jgi:hypothetical protein
MAAKLKEIIVVIMLKNTRELFPFPFKIPFIKECSSQHLHLQLELLEKLSFTILA